MAWVTAPELIEGAYQVGRAIAAFNAITLEQAEAVTRRARRRPAACLAPARQEMSRVAEELLRVCGGT